MRKIVAFAGSKGAGKSTAFEILHGNFRGVHDIALAGHLKLAASEVFNLDQRLFHDQNLKESPLANFITLDSDQIMDVFFKFNLIQDKDFNYDDHVRPHIGKLIETPRKLLQYLGTEVLHPIDPLIHVKYVTKKLPENGLIVITDLRFANEFEYLYDNFEEFIPYHIENNHAEMAAEGDTHPSETDRHKFKHKCQTLDNNGTIYQFKGLVKKTVQEVYNA